ncbi:MAG: hypothetical protein AAB474_00550 [Patescibacteria group bacterium]
MKRYHDFIVVGSGPSGAMAAQSLVEAGADVGMVDVGFYDDYYQDKIPKNNFASIRKSDADQHVYFLGKNFEGISFGKTKAGAQLTPPRQFTTEGTGKWLPVASDNFQPVESLAYGGLGGAWGLACFVYSEPEIQAVGLQKEALLDSYRVIAGRIGISGIHDDGSPYCLGKLQNIQPPTRLESGLNGIYSSYQKNSSLLKSKGFFLGRTPLAMLTSDLGRRKSTEYRDMDFWDNYGDSAYRPAITLNDLKKRPNFFYYGNCLVTRFSEQSAEIEITARKTNGSKYEDEKFYCKKLILAAGTLGTARIVMRSFNYNQNRLPILCGIYCYLPCFQPRMIGKEADARKISYSQLSLFYDKHKNGFDISTLMFYTYSSLMLFRLANELPFNFADALRLLRLGYPCLAIAGLHHPDKGSPDKYIKLVKDESSPTGDKLVINYKLSDREIRENISREKMIKKALRRLGCYPIKRLDPGYGSSIHYGGTLPFNDSGKPFTLSVSGRLNGTENVYVADGSGLRYMPAKGPTFTLMANAHITACNALKSFRHG